MKTLPGWLVMFFLSVCPPVFAHPHIFIDNTVTIVFDKEGMAGIKARWVFDEMFSSMIIHDYDRNQDKKLSAGEIKNIKDNLFSNLRNYHYFTYITIDGKNFPVKFVADFLAAIDANRVVYNFLIPCHVKAHSRKKEIKISMYDSEYYTDIALAEKNPIYFENDSIIERTYEIIDSTENPFYYGQIFPQEIIIKFKKK